MTRTSSSSKRRRLRGRSIAAQPAAARRWSWCSGARRPSRSSRSCCCPATGPPSSSTSAPGSRSSARPRSSRRSSTSSASHDPVLVQYWTTCAGWSSGDFGNSYQQFRPVTAIIGEQLGATVDPVARRDRVRLGAHGRLGDPHRRPRTAGRRGRRRWWMWRPPAFPPTGWGSSCCWSSRSGCAGSRCIGGTGIDGLDAARAHPGHPARRLPQPGTRAEFERALDQPFVLTARMRGMGDAGVRLRHVLRHAVLPAVTLSGWALGATLSGAVVVESIFSRPGIGSVLVTAVNSHDLPVVVGIVTLVAVVLRARQPARRLGYTAHRPPGEGGMTAVREPRRPPRTAASGSAACRAGSRRRSCWSPSWRVAAIAPQLLATHDPYALDYADALQAPVARPLVRHRRVGPRPLQPRRVRRPASRC